MEEKKVMTHVTKGLLASLIIIVVGVIAHFANIEMESWYRWTSALIPLVAIIWVYLLFQSNE